MDVWKKCFQAVMDFIEIYMPMCWFILLFVAFIPADYIQIHI